MDKHLGQVVVCMCAIKVKRKENEKCWEENGFLCKTTVLKKTLSFYLQRQVMCCFSPGVAEQAGGSTLRCKT